MRTSFGTCEECDVQTNIRRPEMLGTDFYVFLLAMVLAIVLLFLMVWHVSVVRKRYCGVH